MAKWKLADLRELHGITRQELCEISDISLGVIRRIERGDDEYAVNERTAEALAEALACTVDEIDWPNGLSHLGRPPHTGRAIYHTHVTIINVAICEIHHLELSVTGVCFGCIS